MTNLPLRDQIALVSGAGSGIGAAVAKAGARVAVNSAHSSEGAKDVVAKITNSGGNAIALQADVRQEELTLQMFG